MDQLNQGSEPDRQTQTANIGRPLAAIGSPPGVYKKSAPTFHLGPAFHTDGENNGRFVAVSKVPHHWTFGSNLQNFFAEVSSSHPMFVLTHTDVFQSGLDRQCHGHVVCLGEIGFVKMLLFFDDIRHATESKTMFYSYLRTAQFEFITREQYFEADKDHPRASVQSQFDGQIQFVAKYIGSARDFDLAATFKTMREYAETFGEIRTFSLLELNDITTTVFRVEYFSLDSADNACEPGDLKEFIELEVRLILSSLSFFHSFISDQAFLACSSFLFSSISNTSSTPFLHSASSPPSMFVTACWHCPPAHRPSSHQSPMYPLSSSFQHPHLPLSAPIIHTLLHVKLHSFQLFFNYVLCSFQTHHGHMSHSFNTCHSFTSALSTSTSFLYIQVRTVPSSSFSY